MRPAALDRSAPAAVPPGDATALALTALRASLDEALRDSPEALGAIDPEYRDSARNLLQYLALRRQDPLGPQTRTRVDELDAGARGAYETFLQRCRDAGEWPAGRSVHAGARYLSEQVGLAVSQRASGENVRDVRETLVLALSVFESA